MTDFSFIAWGKENGEDILHLKWRVFFFIFRGTTCKYYYTAELRVNLKEKWLSNECYSKSSHVSTNGQRTRYYLGTFSWFVMF